MKTIGIIVNIDKDAELRYTGILAESVRKAGGRVVLEASLASRLRIGETCPDARAVVDCSDLVICLGGDGTFLKAARLLYGMDLPILGINLGNLGFLAEIDRDDIENAVRHIFKGDYTIEERMMLDAAVHRKGKPVINEVALNDIVISRGAISRILHVKACINDVFVDSYRGDGLIVSSPTGSTAYSLSAGGPIVEPDARLMIITPICPHILYSRSIITNAGSSVRVTVQEDFQHEAMVTVDGQEGYEISGGDWVEVKKSSHSIKLARINSRNFFNILRAKIYYRGESLRKDEIQQTCKDPGTD
jgi:NAD+ kinase